MRIKGKMGICALLCAAFFVLSAGATIDDPMLHGLQYSVDGTGGATLVKYVPSLYTATDGGNADDVVIPQSYTSPYETTAHPVTGIAKSVFSKIEELNKVTLPEGLQSIGEQAFYWSGLDEINFPSTLTTIGASAFTLTDITSASLPDGITRIEKNTFNNCNRLAKVKLPSRLTYIGPGAFAGGAWNGAATALTDIAIPDSVTEIGEGAFTCAGLTTVRLPANLKTLGEEAFVGCTKLRTVELPEGLTTIPKKAFAGCSALISVTIPSTVTAIGEEAFASCTSLQTVVLTSHATSISKSAFSGSNPKIVYGEPQQKKYTVTFQPNGGSAVAAVSRPQGTTLNLSAYRSVRVFYDFAGWYADSELNRAVSMLTLSGNTTVYARWVSKDIPFTDVFLTDWYYDSVRDVYQNHLMQGASDSLFAPKTAASRAMAVTLLYRLAGAPEGGATQGITFSDVSPSAYYAAAVRWSVQNNILTGYPDHTFRPNQSVTRQELASLFYRYSDEDITEQQLPFTDAAQIALWAQNGAAWCSANGMITGLPDGRFNPQGTATRAQLAAIISRYQKKNET